MLLPGALDSVSANDCDRTAAQRAAARRCGANGGPIGPATPDASPRKLLSIVSLAVAAGLLAAGIVTPVVLGAGLAAKSASNHFESLPTVLPTPILGRDSVILASDGSQDRHPARHRKSGAR